MALPTTLDNLNALMYAIDRVRRERCNRAMTTDSTLHYVTDDARRIYPCPYGVTDCRHGLCKIKNKEGCEARSQFPFKPDGSELDGKKCVSSVDCGDGMVCSKSNKCVPAKPYLEWHTDKCVYGNSVLRRWCEFPSQRRTASVPGVTDAAPMDYDPNTGTCSVSRAYCEQSMKVSFKLDDNGDPTCYTKAGQQVGEFFLGKTLFRSLKETFVDASAASETALPTRRVTLVKNFAGPGIDLFLTDTDVHFDYDAVASAWPGLVVVKSDGTEGLEFTRDDLKDVNKKRVYFMTKNKNWISPGLIKSIRKNMTE